MGRRDSSHFYKQIFMTQVNGFNAGVNGTMVHAATGSTVTYRVTGNCQMSVIGNANSILGNYRISDKDRKEIFFNFVRVCQQPQLLLDINTLYLEKLKELFSPSEIMISANYTNSTGSPMTIVILRPNKP